ncbi:Nitrate/nitrite transporter NarK [Streptomyces sp. 2323.1]|uniref:MFS transporter n=1 Tax=Streptomyces sp. 2323.1 TaxID=1938841 RepID=UPI000BC09C64|nr:MFS transporter [Streptomyces sp. 2323.1]SOE15875.1 Nitrate/nitrite transporter NarK [Streptomyces sp. 2323.1]
MAAACLLGGVAGWSLTAVGAIAPGIADAYGVELATVGLFTTAFAVTYALCQIPAGALVDRAGFRCVGAAGLSVVAAACLLAALEPWPGLAIAARLLAGVGASLCYVAGADLARASGAGPWGQGVFGGISAAAGGVALIVVPWTAEALAWRSPWITSAIFAAAGLVTCLMAAPVPGTKRTRAVPKGARRSVLKDRELYHLAAVHAVTFGGGIVLSNWAALILQRSWDIDRRWAYATASLVLLTTVISRPLGGLLARTRRQQVPMATVVSLTMGALATLGLTRPGPPLLAVCWTLLLGLASGLPFAAVFATAQQRRPDRPASAVGLMNAHANALIFAGTPALGAAVGSGHTSAALTAAAVLWLLPLLFLPNSLGEGPVR